MSMPLSPVKTTAARDLLIALPVAFVLRLGLLLITQRAIDMPDSIHYINMARQFSEGNFRGFDENLPVLYSALAALVHLVCRDWEWAFWTVSLLSSTLLLVPVYHLAHELHGAVAARISILLLALWPWYIDYGSRIAPEALAVTLWFSAVWLLYRGIGGGKFHLWCAVLAFFALHLTRPEGTFLMLGSPIAAVALCYKQDRGHWLRLGMYIVLVVAVMAVYALAMQRIVGAYTVSYRAPMSEDLLDYFQRGAIPLVKTVLATVGHVIPIMLGPFLLIFFGVGFFRYSDADRVPRLEVFLLAFCFIQWSLTVANFSPAPRYLMTVVLAMSLWSVKGIQLLHQRTRYWPRHRWVGQLPLICVLLTFMVGLAEPIARNVLGATPSTPVEYRAAGHWMQANLEPGLILCRKPLVGFYADMPTLGPDDFHTPETLVDLALEHGARYLVYDERYSSGIIPGLQPLFDTLVAHENYTLLNDDISPKEGTRIVIYQLTPPGIEYKKPEDITATSSHMGPDAKRRTAPATE